MNMLFVQSCLLDYACANRYIVLASCLFLSLPSQDYYTFRVWDLLYGDLSNEARDEFFPELLARVYQQFLSFCRQHPLSSLFY